MVSKNMKWRVIKDDLHSAPLNMAIDEVLFRRVERGVYTEPILRLYGFESSAMTVGMFQKFKRDEELVNFYKHNKNATRRITGGGAVYHGYDLTYSIIAHNSAHHCLTSVKKSYRLIHLAVSDALKSLGYKFHLHGTEDESFMGTKKCFNTPVKDDLMLDNKKIAGGAQKRTHGYILHQGSIYLEPFCDVTIGFAHLFSRVRSLFIESFTQRFAIEFSSGALRRDEYAEALVLERNKYAVQDWLFRN